MHFATMVVLGTLVLGDAAASAANLDGRWNMKLDPGFDGEQSAFQCTISQNDRDLLFECDDDLVFGGRLEQGTVTFVIMTGSNHLLPARFSGTLDDAEKVIEGTWRLEDTTGNRIGRFRAEKS